MFAVCSIAVATLFRDKAVAETPALNTAPINTSAINPKTIVSDTNTALTSNIPITNITENTSGTTTETARIVPTNGDCGSANGNTLLYPPSRTDACKAGSFSGVVIVSTGWEWKCLGLNGGDNVRCSAKKKETQNTTTTTASIPTVTDSVRTYKVDDSDSESTSSSTSPSNSTEAVTTEKIVERTTEGVRTTDVIRETTKENPDSPADAVGLQPAQYNSIYIAKAIDIKKQEIGQPIIIPAERLATNENPKISGEVNESLKVESVDLKESVNGKKNVILAGKAEPNALVTIYIFSEDPIVITVKTDENGNWNYELDKEIADGQHEVYVAMTDDEGKIITKSQPIAFVKTAEAATFAPVSEIQNNESPVVRSQGRYVLIALIIMTVCLGGALALIGALTYKRHLNEGNN